MPKVKFKRITSDSDINNIEVEDGNFIVAKNGRAYIDYENKRVAIGGTPDLEMSDTSTNSVQNKVVKKYIDEINSKYERTVTFSKEEHIVGKWINDKFLYAKTIEFGSFPNNAEKRIPHGIENIELIPFVLYGWHDSEDKKWFSGMRRDSDTLVCSITADESNLFIGGRGTNWSVRTKNGYAHIFYTKTVDEEVTS